MSPEQLRASRRLAAPAAGSPLRPGNRAEIGMGPEIALLGGLVSRLETDVRAGVAHQLPGNAYFLRDGRVLCRERVRGDSRYPYGRNGLNYWVSASGYMHGNEGLFFIFLPSREGLDPPVAFFAGVRLAGAERFLPLSLLPVPFLREHEARVRDRYTVFGHDATYFVTQTPELTTAVRVFVDQVRKDHAHVVFSTYLINEAADTLAMYASAYMNPFCRHQFVETNEDRWFKKVHVDSTAPLPREGSVDANSVALPPFVIAVNEDVSRFRSITNHAMVRRAVTFMGKHQGPLTDTVCTAQRAYVGSPRRTLSSAQFLSTGEFGENVPLTVFNDNAVVGDLCRFNLPPGESIQFDYVLSLPANGTILSRERARRISVADTQARLIQVREACDPDNGNLKLWVQGSRLEGLRGETFNSFLPYLKTQVAVCAETNGYMHASPNSLIGMRDIFQAIEGHLFDRPEAAKAKIREALEYVLVDGRCPRQYSLPVNGAPGAADLREFVDQGAWVISALHTYVHVTGDAALLDEELGYHRLRPGDANAIEPAPERDSVLAHLLRIMGYFARQRDPATGLVRALYGDWNDALDGLGTTDVPGVEFGTGVSVMVSLQFYRNCTEMIDLLERFYPHRFADQRARYPTLQSELRDALLRHAVVRRGEDRRILHGWGDSHRYEIGGFEDSDGVARDGLTSNAFWVISGMLDEDASLRRPILEAMERLDSPFGMKTFAPGFEPDAPGVGRIPKLPIGTAENGATYVHATTFGISALFLLGEPRRAWEQIRKILPFSPHQKGISHSPFVLPNSYVSNAELNLTGQNMNDWQTGCSNVLLKLLVRYVFGFQPGCDGLRVAPASWMPFERFDFTCRAHGRVVRIRGSRGDVLSRQFTLNDRVVSNLERDARAKVDVAILDYHDLSETTENVIRVVDPE